MGGQTLTLAPTLTLTLTLTLAPILTPSLTLTLALTLTLTLTPRYSYSPITRRWIRPELQANASGFYGNVLAVKR